MQRSSKRVSGTKDPTPCACQPKVCPAKCPNGLRNSPISGFYVNREWGDLQGAKDLPMCCPPAVQSKHKAEKSKAGNDARYRNSVKPPRGVTSRPRRKETTTDRRLGKNGREKAYVPTQAQNPNWIEGQQRGTESREELLGIPKCGRVHRCMRIQASIRSNAGSSSSQYPLRRSALRRSLTTCSSVMSSSSYIENPPAS